jgi:hypothetical protein
MTDTGVADAMDANERAKRAFRHIEGVVVSRTAAEFVTAAEPTAPKEY